MDWHRLVVTSILFISALPIGAADQAVAQPYRSAVPGCVSIIDLDSGERRLVTQSGEPCPVRSVQVAPVADSWVASTDHSFELFNNSYRDILFLHLFPLTSPDHNIVFGGTRKLRPGYAWRVDLDRGCDYNLLVEYEDGTQDFYENVDTCSFGGLQLR